MLHDIYISSIASWLPDKLTSVECGLKSGEYSKKDYETMGYQSIAIAPSHMIAPEMAHIATQKAKRKFFKVKA